MGSEAKKEGMTYRHHSPLPRTTTGTAEAGSQGLQSESGRSPAETGRARRFEGSRLHACKVASSLHLCVRVRALHKQLLATCLSTYPHSGAGAPRQVSGRREAGHGSDGTSGM